MPYGSGGPAGGSTIRFGMQAANFQKEKLMLGWAATFFIIAIIAAVFGFGGIAAASAHIAQVLFFIFVVLFIVSLIFGLVTRRPL